MLPREKFGLIPASLQKAEDTLRGLASELPSAGAGADTTHA